MKLFKNFISLAAAESVSKLLTFAAFAYLARVVGPTSFGYVEFVAAVMMCATLIVDQGFSPFGAREIAKAPERTQHLVAVVVTARFLLAFGAYLIVILLALSFKGSPVITRLLLIYGISLFAAPFLLQWVFQGHDRMQLVAIAQVIRQLVFAAVVFSFIRGPEQLLFVAYAEVTGICCAALWCLWIYRTRFRNNTRIQPTLTRELFVAGVPIGLSQLFWVTKMFGGTLILGFIGSAMDVGFFAGAQRILVALHSFVWLYYFNLLPSFARNWEQADGSFSRLMANSMRGVVWISALGGILWVLIATVLMKGVYGPAFTPAGTALEWMAGVWVVAFLSGHYRFGLIAAGEQTAEMWASALGAVATLILVPIGYYKAGPAGAAAGLFAAELCIWASAWWRGRRLLNLTGHWKLLVRPLIAVLVVMGLLWMLQLDSIGARCGVALLVLTLLAVVLDGNVRDRMRHMFAGGQRLFRHSAARDLPEVTR